MMIVIAGSWQWSVADNRWIAGLGVYRARIWLIAMEAEYLL